MRVNGLTQVTVANNRLAMPAEYGHRITYDASMRRLEVTPIGNGPSTMTGLPPNHSLFFSLEEIYASNGARIIVAEDQLSGPFLYGDHIRLQATNRSIVMIGEPPHPQGNQAWGVPIRIGPVTGGSWVCLPEWAWNESSESAARSQVEENCRVILTRAPEVSATGSGTIKVRVGISRGAQGLQYSRSSSCSQL